ncbi:prepilin peptidase [Polaribacter porphyrae]|uniref:Prepilin type IV endopeptidase peptidase domain-containing protein n=1 Tax=Polaribacter porphyrae TaxID=1137780 RepID=A0A2S7WSJ8_9FLAO|nr:prepilin peptidase [Polaribacter porphyrae]PQJ80291.1 hypothetical protein BTO18_14375 [Polaribacter porphyrae]
MIISIEIIFIVVLLFLFYQDIKERKVVIWALVLSLIFGSFINYLNQQPIVFISNIFINATFIAFIFGILGLYAKFKMKQRIFDVFGMGDLGFFMVLAVSLPTLSFLMVFIFSTFFALLVFLIFKYRFQPKTVPLAGLQSLFLALVLLANKFSSTLNIYAL